MGCGASVAAAPAGEPPEKSQSAAAASPAVDAPSEAPSQTPAAPAAPEPETEPAAPATAPEEAATGKRLEERKAAFETLIAELSGNVTRPRRALALTLHVPIPLLFFRAHRVCCAC